VADTSQLVDFCGAVALLVEGVLVAPADTFYAGE